MTTISCSRSTKNAVWVGLKTGLVLLVLLLLLLWRFCTPDGTAPEPHQQQHWWRGGPTTTTSTLLRWVSSPQQEQAQVESDRDLAFGPPQPIQTRPTNNPQLLLPGSYRSVEEMMERSQGRFFPSVDDRVRIYMSNWYIPPCAPQPHDVVDTDESDSPFSNFVQYNYWPDPVRGEPLLVLREMLISESTITTTQLEQDGVDGKELSTANSLRDNKVHDNVQDSEGGIFFDPNRKNEYSSGNNNNTRTFLLDAQAIEKGSRLFYLSADAMRKCSSLPCFDTVHFLFPSLHRTDMSVTTTTTSSVDHTLRQQLQNHPSRYPGNALDPLDGNSIGVVPILLQFGDLDVTRSYCPATHLPERFPATPLVRKFRGSVSRAERHRVTTTSTTTADYDDTNTECYPPHARAVPTTRLGERHLQPSTS